jgi:uncharacterized protein
MICFIDTSAFIAVLHRDDRFHARAAKQWTQLLETDRVLLCTNYILVETCALLQYRFGIQAVRTFQEVVAPLLTIEWIDYGTHRSGVAGVLTAARKKLSLVDCVSFAVMRNKGIQHAFTFDKHFKEQGFTVLP